MKDVFETVRAICPHCGTPVSEKWRIGNKFYCAAGYQINSVSERVATRLIELKHSKLTKMVQGKHPNMVLGYDFTTWTQNNVQNVTANSFEDDLGASYIRKNIGMEFGKKYKIIAEGSGTPYYWTTDAGGQSRLRGSGLGEVIFVALGSSLTILVGTGDTITFTRFEVKAC